MFIVHVQCTFRGKGSSYSGRKTGQTSEIDPGLHTAGDQNPQILNQPLSSLRYKRQLYSWKTHGSFLPQGSHQISALWISALRGPEETNPKQWVAREDFCPVSQIRQIQAFPYLRSSNKAPPTHTQKQLQASHLPKDVHPGEISQLQQHRPQLALPSAYLAWRRHWGSRSS